jgi:hypothetical protein
LLSENNVAGLAEDAPEVYKAVGCFTIPDQAWRIRWFTVDSFICAIKAL